MASPEPSFEGFFSTQQRPSTQSSFDLPSKAGNYGSGSGDQYGSFYTQHLGDAPIQYADEPQSLEPRDHRVDQTRQDNGLRKDSVPFDPSSSSTLIASANGGHSSTPGTPGQFQDHAYNHYQFQQQQQQHNMLQQQAGMGGDGSTPPTGDWNNSLLQQQEADHESRRASFNNTPFDDPQQFEELQRMYVTTVL